MMGRGRGRTHNPRFSLHIEHPERASESIAVKVRGREIDSAEKGHQKLSRMAEYCRLRGIYHRWYKASLFSSSAEVVLYLKISHEQQAWNTIKRQVSRYGLSARRHDGGFPFTGETSVPKGQGEEGQVS